MSATADFAHAYAEHYDGDHQIPELEKPAVAAMLETMIDHGVHEIEIDDHDPEYASVLAYRYDDQEWIEDPRDQGALGQMTHSAVTENDYAASIPRHAFIERSSASRPESRPRFTRDELRALL